MLIFNYLPRHLVVPNWADKIIILDSIELHFVCRLCYLFCFWKKSLCLISFDILKSFWLRCGQCYLSLEPVVPLTIWIARGASPLCAQQAQLSDSNRSTQCLYKLKSQSECYIVSQESISSGWGFLLFELYSFVLTLTSSYVRDAMIWRDIRFL